MNLTEFLIILAPFSIPLLVVALSSDHPDALFRGSRAELELFQSLLSLHKIQALIGLAGSWKILL